ncbi:MAG: TonB-dependent receptor [Pseudomonadales bacterium]
MSNAIWRLVVLGSMSALGTHGHAATSEPSGTTAGIEEVVVTAQKREQSQQDVPISMAAFTGEMVESAGAFDITGINGLAPNIILQTQGLVPNVPMFAIRGMNHSDPDPNSDPKISTVIDGVYVPFVAGALLDLFDLERVEILRGPQGTLFGKNNLAGTVNVTTAKPTGEFGTTLRATVGDNGLRHYQARVNTDSFGGDRFAAKLALSKRDYDGFSKDVNTGSRLGGVDVRAARGSLTFVPNDTMDATLVVDYTKDEVDGPAGHSLGVPAIAGRVYRSSQSFDPFTETETLGVSLQSNWSLGEGVVSLVAGHRDLEYFNRGDFDGLPNNPGLDVVRDFEGDYQSVELRYSSPLDGAFDYVAGLYYIQDEWTQINDVIVNPVVKTFGINEQEGRSVAAFAQANFHLHEDWTLTLGGRYTRDKKEFGLLSQTIVNNAIVSEFVVPKSDTWDNFSPRVAVEYRASEQAMLYASVSQGYKGGGYNSRGTLPENIGPYDEETVTAYELGIKSDWLEGMLRFNGAVFFNQFEDLQSSVTRQGSVRTENITTNIAEVETSGVEVELAWLPIPELQLGLNLAYLKSEYTEFCDDVNGPSPTPFASDCGGAVTPVIVDGATQYLVAEDQTYLDLANAPKYSGSVSADYDIPVRTGSLALHGDVRYTSRYNTWGRDNDPGFERDAVALVNANISYRDHDGRYQIMVYGRNLTDKEVMSGAIRTGVNPLIQYYQPPREFGVTATVTF